MVCIEVERRRRSVLADIVHCQLIARQQQARGERCIHIPGKLCARLQMLRDIHQLPPICEPDSPVVQLASSVVQPSSLVVQPHSPVVQLASSVVQPSSLVVQPTSPVVQSASPVVRPDSAVVQPA